MVIFVQLIGIIMVVFGAAYLTKPAILKQISDFWTKGKRLYFGVFLNLVVGILFLRASPQCKGPEIVIVIGVLSLVKGIILAVQGPQQVRGWVYALMKKSPVTIRILALVTIALGALLLYSA